MIGDDEPSAVTLAGHDGARRRRDAGEPGGHPGEPGHVRLDRDRGRFGPVPAAAGRRADRPRGPRPARGGPRPSGTGEQTLLKRLARRRPELFAGRVTCFDRNFRAPRGALAHRPRSGHGLEEVSVGLMAYLDP